MVCMQQHGAGAREREVIKPNTPDKSLLQPQELTHSSNQTPFRLSALTQSNSEIVLFDIQL